MANLTTTITAALISIAVVAAVVILAWHSSITGEAATGILGAIVGGGGVGVAQAHGVKAGADAANSTPTVTPTTPTVSLKV